MLINLGFGAYTGSAIPAATTLSVTCTNGTSYNVALNPGTASGATVTTRAMSGPGGATLNYARKLLLDSAEKFQNSAKQARVRSCNPEFNPKPRRAQTDLRAISHNRDAPLDKTSILTNTLESSPTT